MPTLRLLLYLAAVFCLLQGLNALRIVHHWEEWQATFGSILTAQAEIALYSKYWIALAIVLWVIGYWAQRRLRRRSLVLNDLALGTRNSILKQAGLKEQR